MNASFQEAILGAAMGSGRLVPTVAAGVGLIGVVAGVLAQARPAARHYTIAAGLAGLISAVVGALHSANAAGGIGTGNGLAGAVLAILLGLISMGLAWRALTRSRVG